MDEQKELFTLVESLDIQKMDIEVDLKSISAYHSDANKLVSGESQQTSGRLGNFMYLQHERKKWKFLIFNHW